MKLINITSLLVVAVISFLSSVAVSATEHSDEVNFFIKNLRHLSTGEKPVKGAAKKEKKVKGDSADKDKLSPKVKDDSDKKKGKGVKGESSGKEENESSSKAPKTKPPKEPESKTKKPSEVFESDYPSSLVSNAPTEVPV
jgi:hypothetical protein